MSYFGFEDRDFYKQLLRIGMPLALQQLVSSSITLVDNIMIGRLSDAAMAAVTHANQVSNLLLVCIFGITSAATAFTSQYWGKGELQPIRRTFGLALCCCAALGTVFLIASQLLTEQIIGLFAKEQAVFDMGVGYLRIVSWSYPLLTMTHAFTSVLRGTENVRLPATSAIIGICTNAVLNYIFIFGKLGVPAMGVEGAALATVIAQGVDLTIIVSFTFILKKPVVSREYKMFPIGRDFAKRYAKVGLPVFANESLWSLAQTTTVLMYAQLGTEMSAAYGIFNVFDRLAYTMFVGMANACAVIVGKQIGAGREENAFTYGQRCLRLVPFISIAAGILVNLIAPLLLGVYEISAQAAYITRTMIIIYGLSLPFAVYNYISVIGLMRSGGDTRYSLIVDGVFHWLFTVTGVALGVFVLHVPPQYIYACTIPGEWIKNTFNTIRFRSKKWINNLTH